MKSTGVALSLGAIMLAATAGAAGKSKAENGLIGVKLYDTGTRVISLYGTPDEIDAVGVGGGSTGNGSPFGGGAGGPGGAGMGGGRPGGGRGPGNMGGPAARPPGAGGGPGADYNSPFNFADSMLQGFPSGGASAPGGPAGGSMGANGFNGPPAGAGGFGSGGGAGAPPRGNGGAADNATYTRWIYRRSGSQYGFVFDKFNRVVQIEAIGLSNGKVKTNRGIGFGATFAQIIKAYQAPDGYEISGDNVLVKYLSKAKVAFRLSRLGDKKPQVVTGVVIAAAKG